MKNKFNSSSLICGLKVKNRRYLFLIRDFGFCLEPFSIMGFPKILERVVLYKSDLAKKMGISHLWIFSQEKFTLFLTLITANFTPFFCFRILKFSLKKETNLPSDKKITKNSSPILILNNFYTENSKCLILRETLKKIFPVEESQKILARKFIKIIFFDFDSLKNVIEFRCYQVRKNLILFPRKLRRKKDLKNQIKGLKKDLGYWLKKKTPFGERVSRHLNLIRVEEIGPKFSAKICEFFKKN